MYASYSSEKTGIAHSIENVQIINVDTERIGSWHKDLLEDADQPSNRCRGARGEQ